MTKEKSTVIHVKACLRDENASTYLPRKLQRSDPFREKKCESEDCLVCAEGDGGRCRANEVTYRGVQGL